MTALVIAGLVLLGAVSYDLGRRWERAQWFGHAMWVEREKRRRR